MLKLDATDFDNALEARGCPKVAKIVEMVQVNLEIGQFKIHFFILRNLKRKIGFQ